MFWGLWDAACELADNRTMSCHVCILSQDRDATKKQWYSLNSTRQCARNARSNSHQYCSRILSDYPQIADSVVHTGSCAPVTMERE